MAIIVQRCRGGNISVRSFAVFRVKKEIPVQMSKFALAFISALVLAISASAQLSSSNVSGRWKDIHSTSEGTPAGWNCDSAGPMDVPTPETLCAMWVDTQTQAYPASIQILQVGDRVTINTTYDRRRGPYDGTKREQIQVLEGTIHGDDVDLKATSRDGFMFGLDTVATELHLKLSTDGQTLAGQMIWRVQFAPADAESPDHQVHRTWQAQDLPSHSGVQWRLVASPDEGSFLGAKSGGVF